MRASETDRGLLCPASLVRPRTRARLEGGKSEAAASWGHAVHHWAATGDARGDGLLERKLLLARVRRELLWPEGGHHEHSFALELARARLTWGPEGAGEDHDAWKVQWDGQLYLTGTIDYWACVDGRLWVDDLKTGRRWLYRDGERYLHYDPDSMGQLASYALAVSCAAGTLATEEGADVSVTQWEKYPLESAPLRDSAFLSGEVLRKHLDDVRWSCDNGDVVLGGEEQCRFCECGPDCEVGRRVNAPRIAARFRGLLGG